MNFTIIRAANLMTVGNAVTSMDCSALASNIGMVIWNGDSNTGEIEYSDRPAVRSEFTDPSPYLTLLNTWLTDQAAATPALMLAQAQSIKTGLTDALYALKRTAVISFAGNSWDGSDESVEAMAAALVSGGPSGVNAGLAALISDINTHVAALVTDVNGRFAGLVSDINTNVVAKANTSIGDINTDAAAANTAFTAWNNNGAPNPLFQLNGSYPTLSNVGGETVGGETVGGESVGSTAAWLPAGATATVTVDLAGLLAAIVARRGTLAVTRATKKAALAACANVAAVVAYDITAGW